MKNYLLFIFLASVSFLINGMEVKEANADKDKELEHRFYSESHLAYPRYRATLLEILPITTFVPQDHYVNPLVDAVHARDYELAELLLDKGASPTFRGMNMMNGFDALRLERGYMVDNPASDKAMKELLEKYMKQDEKQTPYSLSGMNAAYIRDEELEQERQESLQKE